MKSPHANLLLHSDTPINFGGTASGHIEYYVCHRCGAQWQRTLARSEADAVWRHSEKLLTAGPG
jgi:hypothetical protein